MELRKANRYDFIKVNNAVARKNITFCQTYHIYSDYNKEQLYVVAEGSKVFATISLVKEPSYGYTAIKRLCILNKKNQGKGIARFAIREIQRLVKGRIGATPWEDNIPVRHLFESEGFVLQYVFNEKWCFYMKEV